MANIYYLSCVFAALLSIVSATDTVEDCPPWSTPDKSNTQCVCSNHLEFRIMCDQYKQTTYLRLGFCALHDSSTNGTVVAACPYVFPDHLIADERIPLPNQSSELNHFTCGSLNRDIGTPLCGRCTNGTGPSIHSAGSQCVSCSAVNIVYYLLLQYLPTTILFLAIIVFRINITSAPMAHYVLFCNGVVLIFKIFAGEYINYAHTTPYKYVMMVGNLFLTLSAIWTLDIFYYLSPPLCISVHMEEIYKPFLDTLAALYPFILLLLAYAGIQLHAHDCKLVVSLWRPLQRTYVRFRRTWDPNASVIQAFATLFFLSYTTFISLMYEALLISVVINEEGKVVSIVSYIDPTVHIFSHKHWYLVSLSVFILVIIILPPLLLLMAFPTNVFRKVSRCLKPRSIVSIQTFVDTFHGCYKDGTNGTRDYRAVSGYILAVWTFLPAVAIMGMALENENHFLLRIIFTILFNILSVACALLRPYKHRTANISGVTLPAIFSSIVVLLVLAPTNFHSTIAAPILIIIIVLVSLPHCVFYGYIVYRMGKLLKQYCCKTQEVEESEDERLLCRPAHTTGYTQLTEVSYQGQIN